MNQPNRDEFALLLTLYEDNGGDQTDFVIPEDLSSLSDEELQALHDTAVGHFDALYADGANLSPTDLATLAELTVGIETLLQEIDNRSVASTERAEAAAALAARVRRDDQSNVQTDADGKPVMQVDADGKPVLDANGNPVPVTDDKGSANIDIENDDDEEDEDVKAPVELVAGAAKPRGGIRVNLSGVNSRQSRRPAPAQRNPQTMVDIVRAAGDVPGFVAGVGMDWNAVGTAVDRRLRGYNESQYVHANRGGRHLREQHGVAVINKPFDPSLVASGNDPMMMDDLLHRAMDESRLPGGSLLASGGWCAPSETIYTLCELESRDGLFSIPEIGIARGGINWTLGPNFADLFAETSFCYTEAEDIDGDYDGAGGGSKPCFRVDCPDFTEARLDLCGLCIQAGLLQQRGYPEVIARTVRGSLIAHDHRMSAKLINAIVTGSTAVTMPAGQAGTTAPLLTAIELQVEHYRYTTRISRGTTLEAVFPFWVHGAVRSDLALRLGVDLLDVSDARIDGWFRSRGINPQFVYNWQDINGTAPGSFTQWPTTVKFLLYSAGTWVKGGGDVITMDTIYDSTLLGTNDFTALFTEEGWLVAKMCHDSRVVTVSVCSDGSTAAGLDIGCDGVAAP
jgi:hypothetical protein